MPRPAQQLRRDALRIWQAGLDAVRSEHLVARALRVEESWLVVGDQRIRLDDIARIAVVGAGKAGAGMAAAVENALGPRLLQEKDVTGWVNVPAGCERTTRRIDLHVARPAGVNEPTLEAARGTSEILRLVQSLTARDLCLCLVSGGGSALLPAPVEAISLEDKLAVTRHLSAAGANIHQLNTVRKQLSRIKGGGLLRACRAGQMVTLIISDVLGDPLDVIASGPTVPDQSTARDALEVLYQFHAREAGIAPRVFHYLQNQATSPPEPPACRVTNIVIGNNATAVEAAEVAARELGYSPEATSARCCEGAAEQVGRDLAEKAVSMRSQLGHDSLISGGEPVVTLADIAQRGLGGRNQQLVLAALERLEDTGASGIAILSAGTDGEDGPTDAAGATIDETICGQAHRRGFSARDFLARNDAYHFFQPLGALIKTGPTHTNVCDLRVVLVDRIQAERP